MLAGTAVARESSGPDYGIYAYTAREWDPEINLYYYRARYYDPKIGRFVSEDPLGHFAGPNYYAYVLNNPPNLGDAFGLDPLTQNKDVRRCMCELWKASGYGFHPQERAAWVLNNKGAYSCLRWPWTAQAGRETWKGPIPKGAVGIAHTHPTRRPQGRSSPRPSGQDCKTAKKFNISVYVVSDDGVWKCDPCKKETHEEKEDPSKWCE